MVARENLVHFLQENGVHFETIRHPPAYTAQEIAAAEHVPGRFLAKVVMVVADGRLVMTVLPATHRLDLGKLKEALKANEVRLAREEEFIGLFPDCEVGAMSPFGNLYGVPTYVDKSLAEDPEIYFLAGTHQESIKISSADYARLAQPILADFAVHA